MDRVKNVATLLEKSTLVWERHFSVAPEKLWNAVSTKEGLSRWFMPTKFEIEKGGRFSFHEGWDGIVSELVPPHYIVFIPDESQDAYLRFDVIKTENGCLFKLTDKMGSAVDASEKFPDSPSTLKYQPGGIGTHWSGATSGFHSFVDALEEHITGRQQDFLRYEDLNERYCEVLKEWHLVVEDI